MNERESTGRKIPEEDIICLEELIREPGFKKEFADTLIFIHKGKIVGMFSEDLFCAFPDDDSAMEIVRKELSEVGVDMKECTIFDTTITQ